MTKELLKSIALVLAIILLLVICINVYDLKNQVDRYESDRTMLYNMQNNIINIQNKIDNRYNDIKVLLEEGQSLFSDTSVNIKLQDKKLAVTMNAVPKEINNSEKLIAKITAGDKVYEQEADENGTAVILVDMIDVIKPMFIIKSETGIRQETLPEQHTNEALSIDVHAQWEDDDSWNLNLWILKTDKELPFSKSDIAKADFILIKMEEIVEEEYEEYIEYSKDVLSSDFNSVTIPAEELEGGEGKMHIGFTADFSEYADKKEGLHYEIHFVLTTKDGMKYTSPYNAVASFSSYQNGSNKGCGSDILRPIFE